jgi:molybdate transport system substrate-binding protein
MSSLSYRIPGRCPAVVIAACLLTAGCGGKPSSPAADSADALSGALTVFAAASLTEPLNDDRSALQRAHPGLHVTCSYAGSQQLVAQLRAGAPADVVATADEASMGRLTSDGLVDSPAVLAHNLLEIAVAPGNPKHVRGLSDLSRADLKLVLEDPSVPAGRYAGQALQRSGVAAHPVSLELDVRSALQKVVTGEVDVGIVYVTDVASAGGRVTGVPIPADENAAATYMVAVVRSSHVRGLAGAFVNQLLHGAGEAALRSRGFAPP